jgi:hypothetical protein
MLVVGFGALFFVHFFATAHCIAEENVSVYVYTSKIQNIAEEEIVKLCSCCSKNINESVVFDKIRKNVPETAIPDQDVMEFIDDFYEVRNKIYDLVGLACRIQFARKAYKQEVDINIILDCINNNLYGVGNLIKISEEIIKDIDNSIKYEILLTGSGIPWKDIAKYDFIKNRLFKEKLTPTYYKQLPHKKYTNYMDVVKKVYDFACESHAQNCKYYIARSFIRHGIDKKTICKIFDFSNSEYEKYVKI